VTGPSVPITDEQMLIRYVKAGMTNQCLSLIEHGVNVNAVEDVSETGQTVLSNAVFYGRVEIAKILIEAGADPAYREKDSTGRGLLHIAAQLGDKDMLGLLIASGLPVDAVDRTGRTALHIAANVGFPMVCRVLIDAGAKVDALDKSRRSPLFNAAVWGYLSICRMLVDAGAPASDSLGDRAKLLTPLQIAVQNNWPELARYFIEECGADIDQVTHDGRTLERLAKKSPGVRDYLRSLRTERAIVKSVAMDAVEPGTSARAGAGFSPL
jgi:ankyrin repeat protein